MVAEQFEVNEEIAKIFHHLGVFLEMEGVDFKPAAYQRAAAILRTLNRYQRARSPRRNWKKFGL